MKKQALRAVTMLVSIIALAFMTAVASNAQSGGQKFKADIPFDFVVGDKTLAAGEYSVGKITTGSTDGILVSSRDSRQRAIRLTNTVQAGTAKKRAMLIFHRYGSTYFLSQVWTSGSAEGHEMLKSKAERVAERELSLVATRGGETPKSAQPETVTIFAEIE